RPEIPEGKAEIAKVVGQEQPADHQHDSAADPPAGGRGIHHLHQADDDQDDRPVRDPVSPAHDVQVSQQEQYSDRDQDQPADDVGRSHVDTHNYAPAVGVAVLT